MYNYYIVFNKQNQIELDYDFSGYGTVEGDFDFGDLYIELDGNVVNAISERLGFEFTPTYKILTEGYDSSPVYFNVPSPFECFAAGSGIDETKFNEAFTRAIYFGCGEDCDYHAIIHFTAKYSYMGELVKSEHIWHDGYERISVDFSLEGLVIPVEDVTINNGNIVFGANAEPVLCTFDGTEAAISSDSKFTVSGKQATCTETTVTALNKSFTKMLKMESATQVTFTTATDSTLKIYVDTAGKKLKVDCIAYTSEVTSDGDNVITVTLPAGAHTIGKVIVFPFKCVGALFKSIDKGIKKRKERRREKQDKEVQSEKKRRRRAEERKQKESGELPDYVWTDDKKVKPKRKRKQPKPPELNGNVSPEEVDSYLDSFDWDSVDWSKLDGKSG